MTLETPTQLKARFENGDVPDQTAFGNLIDSCLNLQTTDDQTILSNTLTMENVEASTMLADIIQSARFIATKPVQNTVHVSANAAGTTQGTGTVVTAAITVIAIATAGVNDAVTLPAVGVVTVTGASLTIKNLSATAVQVFPDSGNWIDTLATNAAFSVAANKAVSFIQITNRRWISV